MTVPRRPIAAIAEAVNRAAPPTPWERVAAIAWIARVLHRHGFDEIGAELGTEFATTLKALNYASIGLRTAGPGHAAIIRLIDRARARLGDLGENPK